MLLYDYPYRRLDLTMQANRYVECPYLLYGALQQDLTPLDIESLFCQVIDYHLAGHRSVELIFLADFNSHWDDESGQLDGQYLGRSLLFL